MQDYIDMISNNLKYILKTEDENSITFLVESKVECLVCLYCGQISTRCHFKYKNHLMIYH